MVAALSATANSYEEARNKRLEENKRKFQDLGISSISKTLSQINTSETKPQRVSKPKAKSTCLDLEPRRSSRPRNPIVTYQNEIDIGLPTTRRRRSNSSSLGSYLARPLEECRIASYEEKTAALKAAEKLQENLQSENPSFIKSMVRSHVYSCFWLGLPSRFCEDHLLKARSEIVLEDEDGNEYNAVYLSNRTGLSGGWRAFALEHKLDDGDALVFELTEPARFKIYTVKASAMSNLKRCKNSVHKEETATAENASKAIKPDSQPYKKRRSTRNIEPVMDDSKASPELESNQKRRSKRGTVPEIAEIKTSPALGSIQPRRSKRGTVPELAEIKTSPALGSIQPRRSRRGTVPETEDSKTSPNLPTESLKEVSPMKVNSVAPRQGRKKAKANRIRNTQSPEGSEVEEEVDMTMKNATDEDACENKLRLSMTLKDSSVKDGCEGTLEVITTEKNTMAEDKNKCAAKKPRKKVVNEKLLRRRV